ncbi:MAG: YfhO family protein [Clostridia bacterium]|nr:YfhO family protein [Clostridia bacterium]
MKFKNPFKVMKSNEKLLAIKTEYGYLANAFFIPAIIMLAIYFAFGHKPFGDISVLTLDLNAQYVYFYEALREFLHGDASLLYSFSRSLGGEFMVIYDYYNASPLSYIVALFPKSMILFALLTIIVIKIGLCGLAFGFYLHKQGKNTNKNNIILFATMYALSAYAITYQNNIMWLDGLFLLPILTYAVELLIKKGKIVLYIAVLALVMMSHYYIGYMMCWYTLFCFFFTYFKDSDRNLINPNGEKRHFLKSFARIGVGTVVGIGMAAFIIGAAYYSLQFGKNEFSKPNWDMVANFDLFDLFPKLLPGSYDTVMHEGLPLLYSGVLTLFMLPIFVMAKRVPSREKIFYGAFSLLFVLIMAANPTDLIMHGFQEPNCLNYRYSFIVIFLMLIMAYKAFCEIGEHSPKKIFATGASIIALLLVAQKMEFPNFVLQDTEQYKYGFTANKLPFLWVVVFSIIAIFAIGAILCHLIKTQNKKSVAQILFLAICVELFVNGVVLFASMRYNIGWGTYSSYYDYFKDLTPIVETVQEQDKTFYRSEKTTHRCTNDNMALNIKGLSNSTSTLNQKAIDLIEYLGFYADAHWTQYLGSTALTDAIFGVKYIYSVKENPYSKETLAQNGFMDKCFEKVAEDENYYAYKNPYALGIAFGVNDAIKNLETTLSYDYKVDEGLKNPFEVQNLLLNTLLGNDEESSINFFTPIKLNKGKEIIGNLGTVGGSMEYSSSSSDSSEESLEFKFTVKKSGPLYLFLPTGYERSFTMSVNGEHYVQSSNYSRIISLGYREAGEEMSLKFKLDEGKLYFFKNTNYLYTLDMDELEHAIEKLAQTSLVTSEKSTDDHIFGSITTHESNKTIMTTIPYDKGWKVYVDGKQVDTYSIYGDSLMAFDVENAGEHEIEFKYMPKIYVIGGIISGASFVLFVGIWIFEARKNKKVAVQITETATEEIETKEEKTEGEN